MFKGGLGNHSEKTIRLHTAHHLLFAGLQNVVDKNIKQRGSNITEERLRMDFLCDHKLTEEEKKKVEDWVNDKIKENLNVVRREMPLAEAEKLGAEMEFGAKYPDMVSVYFIEEPPTDLPLVKGRAILISIEFCGGPHVKNTGGAWHLSKSKKKKPWRRELDVSRLFCYSFFITFCDTIELMGIFSKNKKNKLILVFHIGSSNVEGALFWAQDSGVPRIIFSSAPNP